MASGMSRAGPAPAGDVPAPRRPALAQPGQRALGTTGRLLLGVTAVAVLGFAGTNAARTARAGLRLADPHGPTATDQQAALYHGVDDLRLRLAAAVPAGSRVFVAALPPGPLWAQRVAEVLTLNGIRAVSQAGAADFRISVYAAGEGRGTALPRLVVERLR